MLAAVALGGILTPASIAEREWPAMRVAEAAPLAVSTVGPGDPVAVSTSAADAALLAEPPAIGACEAAIAALGSAPPADALATYLDDVAAARRRAFASMSAGDIAMQAALLYLTAVGVHPLTRVPPPDAPPATCEEAVCAPVPPPADPADDDRRRRVVAAVDDLARLAIGTADGRVYALAWRSCLRHRDPDSGFGPAACNGLSAERWAQLDASNAMAWLAVASEAAIRHETGAVDEAMHRFTGTSRSDSGLGLLATAVTEPLAPDDARTLAGFGFALEALSAITATVLPSYETITGYCNPAAVADVNRRQTCGGIADAWTRRPDNLMELSIGIAIGRRSGWTSERADAAKAERDALTQAAASVAPSTIEADARGCDTSRRLLDHFRDWGRVGEVGAARLALERQRASAGSASGSSRGISATVVDPPGR